MRLRQITEASELMVITSVAKVVGVAKFRQGLFYLFTHPATRQASALAVAAIIKKTWGIYADTKHYPLTKKRFQKIVATAWSLSSKDIDKKRK